MTCWVEVKLERELPIALLRDIESNLGYLSEGVIATELRTSSEGLPVIALCLAQPEEGLEGQVRSLVQRMSASYRPIPVTELWASPHRAACSENAMAALEEGGHTRSEGSGLYALGPLPTGCLKLLEKDLDGLARALGAVDWTFPDMIPLQVLRKCGYFESFPHFLNFSLRPMRRLESIRAMIQGPSGLEQTLPRVLAPPEYAQQPALCYHCYARLEDQDIKAPMVIHCQGKCYRYEGIRLGGLARLHCFTLRECVFIGPADFVSAKRQESIELTKALINRWRLEATIENANDPFFVDRYASQRFFQLATKVKYELLARLPFEQRKLAIGSFNVHGDYFAQRLNVSLGGKPANTGCIGFGLERWVYAFLAQHGIDPDRWPDPIREDFVNARERRG